jgi:hypothetical protein
MKVDFTKIKLLNINKIEMLNQNLHKTIANVMYVNVKTLDLVEAAMQINRGEAVELNEKELKEIKEILISYESGIAAFARKAIKDFIEELGNKKEQ